MQETAKTYIPNRDLAVHMAITRDEDVLGGEPRIEGTRVGVRHVVARVIEGDQSPAYVADQLDLSMADVYAALSYYYDNIDEIEAYERENREAYEEDRDAALDPKETIQ